MFGVYLFFGMFVAVIGFVFGYGIGFNQKHIINTLRNLDDDSPR